MACAVWMMCTKMLYTVVHARIGNRKSQRPTYGALLRTARGV